jgi:hypothetical protein
VHVFARIVDLRGEPLADGGIVLTRNGADVLALPIIDGLARGALPSSALVPGTLRFQVHTEDGSALGDVVIRVMRADGARVVRARGGACAAVPGAGTMPVGGWVALLMWCVAAGVWRGRRRGRRTK